MMGIIVGRIMARRKSLSPRFFRPAFVVGFDGVGDVDEKGFELRGCTSRSGLRFMVLPREKRFPVSFQCEYR